MTGNFNHGGDKRKLEVFRRQIIIGPNGFDSVGELEASSDQESRKAEAEG